jgi:hypothetical protein
MFPFQVCLLFIRGYLTTLSVQLYIPGLKKAKQAVITNTATSVTTSEMKILM